jgi:rsbT co-antagonist protein RsbR
MGTAPTYSIDPAAWSTFALLQQALDMLSDPFFVKDLQHRWVACNQAFCDLLGHPRDMLIGKTDTDFVPAEQAEVFWRVDDMVVASGQPHDNEEVLTDGLGNLRTIWTRKFPLRDSSGRVIGLSATITDITPIKQRQQQVERLEQKIQETIAILDAQTSLLDELSVPVIQVWESVLLLPLVGVIDDRRAARVMENMLQAISTAGAQFVILDITGVPLVDTSVAGYLVRAVQAAQLLGCQSILVGISPEIAQTLVTLGVDFSQISTRATLQNGLEYVLKRLAYMVSYSREQ